MLSLKQIRKEKNLKVNDIIKPLGITRIALWNYENGKRIPSPSTIVKLASVLNVSIEDVVKCFVKEGA